MALGRELVLPERKARSLEEVFERCPELKDVFRVVSEHAISGYKRFEAASDIYRNRLSNMDDLMNGVCRTLELPSWANKLIQKI